MLVAIEKEKGIDVLLDAAKELGDKYKILLIGSTLFGKKGLSPYAQKVRRQCLELGNKVVFTGYVPNDELWKYYKSADIAVLPSMWE